MTTARDASATKTRIWSTEYGIPIRNLWHMLLYAWNEPSIDRTMTTGEIESAPTLDALFALVLTRFMRQRMRIGLGHAYVDESKRLRGIRGRINFSETLKHGTFENNEVDCDFQQYGANEPRNQIIRSTLMRLVKTGEFGPNRAEVDELRHGLRWLVRSLDGISLIDLTPALINRYLVVENDRDYRLMLSVCELFIQRQMPLDAEGTHPQPRIDRDAVILHRIYEKFVASFYRIQLKDWEVTAQKRLDWHAQETNDHLPSMIPDLVLKDKRTGQIVILDTKFTAGSLIENRWNKQVFDSTHLYQLYAYLRSQEHLSEAHRTASGILLYPAVQQKISDKVQLQDHTICLETVDLAAPWQEVEKQLLEIVEAG